MTTVGEAFITIRPETSGFTREIDRSVGNGLKNLGRKAGQTIATGLTVAAGAGAALGVSLAKVGVSYNALEQSSLAAFKTLLGSADAAKQMQASVREFAKTSPFPRQVFIEGTQQLLGFGVAAEQIVPTLSAIQDSVAAVGGSADDISNITYALAQVKGQGKLTGETLNQLGQYGIDAASIIGKQMGKTSQEIRDMASKPGGIPADQVFDLLVNGMTEKFGGAAEGLKDTWIGALDRIRGAWRDIGSELVAPFVGTEGGGAATGWANQIADALRSLQANVLPALRPILDEIALKVSVVVSRVTEFVKRLNGADVAKFVGTLKGFLPVIAGIGTAIGLLGSRSIPILSSLLGGINPVAGGLLALAATVPEVRSAFADLLPVFGAIAKDLVSKLAPVLPKLARAFGDIIAPLAKVAAILAGALGDALAAILPALGKLAVTVGEALAQAMQRLSPVLNQVAKALGGALQRAVEALVPLIPTIADAFALFVDAAADVLVAVLPVVPVLADLAATAAELIAALPPGVIQAIVVAFLGFKTVSALSGPLAVFGRTLGTLGTNVGKLSLATKAIGVVTAAFVGWNIAAKNFDSIGTTAEKRGKSLGKALTDSVGSDDFVKNSERVSTRMKDLGLIIDELEGKFGSQAGKVRAFGEQFQNAFGADVSKGIIARSKEFRELELAMGRASEKQLPFLRNSNQIREALGKSFGTGFITTADLSQEAVLRLAKSLGVDLFAKGKKGEDAVNAVKGALLVAGGASDAAVRAFLRSSGAMDKTKFSAENLKNTLSGLKNDQRDAAQAQIDLANSQEASVQAVERLNEAQALGRQAGESDAEFARRIAQLQRDVEASVLAVAAAQDRAAESSITAKDRAKELHDEYGPIGSPKRQRAIDQAKEMLAKGEGNAAMLLILIHELQTYDSIQPKTKDIDINIQKALDKLRLLSTQIGIVVGEFIRSPFGGGGSSGGGGFRQAAHGGPVAAGQTLIVGEKGPELFRSHTAGTIIPNNKLGKTTPLGGPVTVTINQTIRGNADRHVLDASNDQLVADLTEALRSVA